MSAFTKASQYLSKWFNDPQVKKFLDGQGVSWEFSAAFSPRELGIVERLVAIFKRSLYCSMNKRKLDKEYFPVLINEIMSMMNNRPLTYLSNDDDTNEIITPFKLLYGFDHVRMNFLTRFEIETPSDSGEASDPSYNDLLKMATNLSTIPNSRGENAAENSQLTP